MRINILCGLAFVLGSWLSFPQIVCGQADDIIDQLILKSPHRRLPSWHQSTKETTQRLSHTARKLRDAVFLVGHPMVGDGTAFVISRKHRLLATNAHVADIAAEIETMYAIHNQTKTTFEVEQIWYHPAVLRKTPEGVLKRSENPGTGDIFGESPDVAVLKLKPGSEIPAEVVLANQAEIDDLFGLPVGMIGFPGYDTAITDEAAPIATFRDGAVSHVCDFSLSNTPNTMDAQLVQHTMANWHGFSGSPIFLENGHVVALNNMHRIVKQGEESTIVSYGIRIDCLWELLKHHRLEMLVVPEIPVSEEQMRKHVREPIAPDEDRVKAVEMLKTDGLSPLVAIEKVAKAIELAPNLACAYYKRGLAYQERFNELMTQNVTDLAILLEPLQSAITDYQQALKLDSSDPDYAIALCDVARHRQNPLVREDCPKVIEALDSILAIQSLTKRQQASALCTRALCHFDWHEDLKDLDKAIAIAPLYHVGYSIRALVFRKLNDFENAKADDAALKAMSDAEESSKKAREVYHELKTRDFASYTAAITAARNSCRDTDWKNWVCLDNLATIYADHGEYDNALKYEHESLKYTDDTGQRLYIRDGLFFFRKLKAEAAEK